MTRKQQEDVAIYLMSRADQYENESPCWVALSDAAHNVVNGAVEGDLAYQGDDPEMRKRVRKWREKPLRKVDPKLGIEP